MLVWKAMLMPEEDMESEEEWPPIEVIESVPEEPPWSSCLVKSAIVRITCLGWSMLGFISFSTVFPPCLLEWTKEGGKV